MTVSAYIQIFFTGITFKFKEIKMFRFHAFNGICISSFYFMSSNKKFSTSFTVSNMAVYILLETVKIKWHG